MKKKVFYFICPHCGETVPSTAPCCPGCGSDPETGWSSSSEDENSAEYPQGDAEKQVKKRKWAKYLVPVAGVILACVFLAAFVPLGFAIGLGGVIIIGACVYLLYRRYSRSPKSTERRLRLELLMLLGGDRDQMERLIAHERMRSPGADTAELLDRAIYRLRRDRR